jgi:hypothetical protein
MQLWCRVSLLEARRRDPPRQNPIAEVDEIHTHLLECDARNSHRLVLDFVDLDRRLLRTLVRYGEVQPSLSGREERRASACVGRDPTEARELRVRRGVEDVDESFAASDIETIEL